MSTTVVNPPADQATEPQFDPKEFLARRNAAEAGKSTPPAAAKPEEKKPEDKPAADAQPGAAAQAAEPDEPGTPRMSRSQRREHNRLLRELGEERGRRMALEEMLKSAVPGQQAPAKAEKPATDDPQPQQADFTDHNEYVRALARWEGRQETKKILTKDKAETEQQTALRERIQAMDAKAQEDIKTLDDWDQVQKDATEDGPEFVPSEHPNLMGLIATSDMKAFVLYHFAKHPTVLERFLELSSTPQEQIREFARLEGRIEKLYAKDPAAQAAGEAKDDKSKDSPKDRTTPEKAAQARETAADRDARKPKPTAEVSAKGGQAAPEEPAIGSAAWMARRNQAQFGK